MLHELGAHDPARESGVILDIGRLLEQTAPREALDDQGLEVGAGRVERRGVARRPTPDDDHFLDPFAHFIKYSLAPRRDAATCGPSAAAGSRPRPRAAWAARRRRRGRPEPQPRTARR